MNYQAILKDINNNKISPLYLLISEENYFKDKIIAALKKKLFGESEASLNFYYFYAEDSSAQDILQQASTYSFFSDKKLIAVNNLEKFSANSLEILKDCVKTPLKTTCLVMAGKKIDKRLSFYKNISKQAVVLESKAFYAREAKSWAEEEIKKYNKKIEPKALEALITLVGNSLKNLEMEIEKLVLFAGDKKLIAEHDVKAIVTPQREYDNFELMEAILDKNKPKALLLLFAIIKDRKSYEGYGDIIGLIRWQLLRIIQGKELVKHKTGLNEIARKLRMPAFFINKFINQSKNFSTNELSAAFEKILKADLALKSNLIPKKIILEQLIISLTAFRTNLSR